MILKSKNIRRRYENCVAPIQRSLDLFHDIRELEAAFTRFSRSGIHINIHISSTDTVFGKIFLLVLKNDELSFAYDKDGESHPLLGLRAFAENHLDDIEMAVTEIVDSLSQTLINGTKAIAKKILDDQSGDIGKAILLESLGKENDTKSRA